MAKVTPTPEAVVLSATEKATKAVNAATVALGKVVAELAASTEQNEIVLMQVAEGQAKLNGLATETANAVREQAIDLDFQVRENASSVLARLMREAGLATITNGDHTDLVRTLEAANVDNTVAIEKAVQIAVKAANATAAIQLAKVVSDHAVESASLKADAKAKDTEIAFLTRNVATLEATITSEREARVSMAASAAQAAGVVVNTSGK